MEIKIIMEFKKIKEKTENLEFFIKSIKKSEKLEIKDNRYIRRIIELDLSKNSTKYFNVKQKLKNETTTK
jgi:hypothetical protein